MNQLKQRVKSLKRSIVSEQAVIHLSCTRDYSYYVRSMNNLWLHTSQSNIDMLILRFISTCHMCVMSCVMCCIITHLNVSISVNIINALNILLCHVLLCISHLSADSAGCS